MELDTQITILAQSKLLTQQIEALTKQIGQLPQQYHQGGPQKTHQAHQVQQIFRYDFCGDNHQNGHCSAPGDGQQEEKPIMCRTKLDLNKNFKEVTKAIVAMRGKFLADISPFDPEITKTEKKNKRKRNKQPL